MVISIYIHKWNSNNKNTTKIWMSIRSNQRSLGTTSHRWIHFVTLFIDFQWRKSIDSTKNTMPQNGRDDIFSCDFRFKKAIYRISNSIRIVYWTIESDLVLLFSLTHSLIELIFEIALIFQISGDLVCLHTLNKKNQFSAHYFSRPVKKLTPKKTSNTQTHKHILSSKNSG